jgi:hypothetical protein
MKILNEHFPNHEIPFRIVQDFVESCVVCQKERKSISEKIKGSYRTIKQPTHRSAIGVDNVTITPMDKNGNTGATVVINLFTRLVAIYPYKSISSRHTSLSVLKYICSYGLVDEIHTDPGSDFTSNIVSDLNKLLGTVHKFSLVDRHQSNGVERTIKEITRHLRALCYSERVTEKWSDDSILPIISFIINSSPNLESGSNVQNFSAFLLTFGSFDAPYLNLNSKPADYVSDFVRDLDKNFQEIHSASRAYQDSLVQKRSIDNDQPTFQPGDLVLKRRKGPFRPSKLAPLNLGPFEVISQYKNDVEMRHLALGNVQTTHIENLAMYTGSRADALEVALIDADQHWIDTILRYHGFPELTKSMEFLVKFADGEEQWLPLSKDLSATLQFENFCNQKPELNILLLDANMAKKFKAQINRDPMPSLVLGYKAYYDLKFLGFTWFDNLDLPNIDKFAYIVEYEIVKAIPGKKQFVVKSPVFSLEGKEYLLTCDHYWFFAYGYTKVYDPLVHILVNSNLTQQYPQILEEEKKK